MKRETIDELAKYYDSHDTADGMEGGHMVEPVRDPMVVVSLRLSKSIMDQVRKVADDRDVRPTALIRQWVEASVATTGEPFSPQGVIEIKDLLEFLNQRGRARAS